MPSGSYADVVSTAAQNTFTRGQIIQTSISDALLDSELVVDGTFPNLANWNDDASGWNVVSGGLTHAPGAFGTLTQDITAPVDGVYVLEFRVSGMTTGYVEIYDSSNLDKTATVNGTYKTIGYAANGTDTITISVDDTFDGKVESVSVKQVLGGFPAHLQFFDTDGGLINEFRFFNGSLYMGLDAGKYSQNSRNLGIGNGALDSIVDQNDNLAFGNGAGSGAFCNNGLFYGTYSGVGETVDNRVHIGNNGDIISGTQASGDPTSQSLKFHAMIINMADIPTSSAGLNPGDVWNDSGVMKIA